MDYSVIVLAAGKHAGQGESYKKALASFNDTRTVLGQTISIFLRDNACKQIVIIASSADLPHVVKSYDTGKIIFVKGGRTRKESVLIGLTAVSEDVVLIHDGVRPWLKQPLINKLLERMETEQACVLGLQPTGVVRRIENGYIVETVETHDMIQTQTPQAYHTSFILKCYAQANRDDIDYLDDSLVASTFSDVPIAVEEGDFHNRRFILKNR